jgi:hypothetical protein
MRMRLVLPIDEDGSGWDGRMLSGAPSTNGGARRLSRYHPVFTCRSGAPPPGAAVRLRAPAPREATMTRTRVARSAALVLTVGAPSVAASPTALVRRFTPGRVP